ncbi:MAG: hypothetical protein NC429_12425 [Lachnospiraceae bacterium]|nr:hypothetical protein [Lachnospiraceae bacterium]
MKNKKSHYNNIGISSELDIPRIKHLMKIGLAAGVMVLIGDMILGYGAADAEVSGIPVTFARYLTVSDRRLFWAALLGMIGIPLECLCFFAIYRLIAHESEKYAHVYRTGIFGCLIFGGCGVHVPCCAMVFFLKKIYEYNPGAALEMTEKYLLYFLAPATVLFLVFFFLMIVTQIRAFAKGLTPLPKWTWIFSLLFGLLAAALFKIPNLPLTNALATGWISIGNIWMFGGLLLAMKKIKE